MNDCKSWYILNVNCELQLTILINTMQGLLTATLLCRSFFVGVGIIPCQRICMFVCAGREAMQLGGWQCIFLCNQIAHLLSFIAVSHPWMSVYFSKMKKMIACFFLLFGHTLLSTVSVMAKDLPGGHFLRRRDVNSQYLLGKLPKNKTKPNPTEKQLHITTKSHWKYKW